MIEIAAESLLSLAEAARLLPSRRAGRPTHISTVYRWAMHGVRGVKLEAIRIGGALYTSKEALQRFAERLTAQQPAIPEVKLSKAAESRATQVERELERAGI